MGRLESSSRTLCGTRWVLGGTWSGLRFAGPFAVRSLNRRAADIFSRMIISATRTTSGRWVGGSMAFESTEWIIGGFGCAFFFHLAGWALGVPLRALESYVGLARK